MRRGAVGETPRGLIRYSTGSPPGRGLTPWCSRRQEPRPPKPREDGLASVFELPVEIGRRTPAGSRSAIPGRKLTQDPMLGRPGSLAARLHEGHGRIVIDGLGMDRLDDRQIVDHLARPRQQLAHPGPGLAIPPKLEDRTARPGKRACPEVMRGDAAGPCGRSRAGPCRTNRPSWACNQTDRAARGRRSSRR